MEPNLENLYLSSELTLCKKVHSSFFFVTTKNLATGSGTKLRDKFVLKVMETTDLPKPIKMAFKTMDIITKNSEVLFRRLELLNPGIKTTYWKLIDRQADSKRQRLILLINQESAKILKRMNLAAYTGLDKGFFKILSD
jgi:hypothetical protein